LNKVNIQPDLFKFGTGFIKPNGTAIGCVNPPVGGQAVTWRSSRPVKPVRRLAESVWGTQVVED